MMAEARALWSVAPGRAEIRPASAPDPEPGYVRVRTLVSGISRGTESLVFQGRVPESEWQRMRAPFQEGAFPFPVKYGYAAVGVIEGGPANRIGEPVLCLYPHQSRFTVPADAILTVPRGLAPERAVLAPQIETALNAHWDGASAMGDRIAIVGAGVIGCLTAWLAARLPGAEVVLIDSDPSRRAIAERLGVSFAHPDSAPAQPCDLVFHASGTGEGLDLALRLAGFEARVIELSWYGAGTVPVPLGGAFHSQRLSLSSSQVGHMRADRRGRWDNRRRLALALSLASDARLDVLLGEEIAFESLPDRLPDILGRTGALCTLVRYAA
jgi:NADPH:quinone reductase-like Zn-dependent oxidoreductase